MTRAIILAAGLGTRMGTLSDERPKPLLPVCNVPLIRYAVALLRGAGIDEIAVNLHHRGELIRAELGDGFHYSEERRDPRHRRRPGPASPTGSRAAAATRSSWSTASSSSDIDVAATLRHHDATNATATMVVREVPDAHKWGAIDVADDGRITGIIGQGRPGAHACMFTGVHVLSPRLVARLPPTGESDSIRQAYIPALLAGERIEALRFSGYWHEHSTPERYLQGNWNLLAGSVRLTHPPAGLGAIAPDAIVEPGAQLSPRVVVGARAVVRADRPPRPRRRLARQHRRRRAHQRHRDAGRRRPRIVPSNHRAVRTAARRR